MLIATLNYNQPDLTDNLVNQLRHDDSFNSHELMVLDNGSKTNKAKSTTHELEENIWFGGGLNTVLEYYLSTRHEYFVLFNNDLIFHGPRLITNMINEMRENDLALYSPAINQIGVDQCFWKQMWNWGTGTVRKVPFIDFMCPVIRRDLAEAIVKFPDELFLGWGADFYSGMVAEQQGLKVGVSDNITLAHLVSQAFKADATDIKETDFCKQADGNMHNYFLNHPTYKEMFIRYRQEGANYHA